MKILIPLLILFMSNLAPNHNSEDCSKESFLGTWEGKVFYGDDELKSGPYIISFATDGKTLLLTDEKGIENVLELDGCSVIMTMKEENLDAKSVYTLKDGELIEEMTVKFNGPDGKPHSETMKGLLKKIS